jgi:hypothetical protein
MAVRDPRTEWLRVKIYRSMTPQKRVKLALDLIDMARRSAVANIKLMYPEIDEQGLKRELRRRVLPPDLFARVERFLKEHPRL